MTHVKISRRWRKLVLTSFLTLFVSFNSLMTVGVARADDTQELSGSYTIVVNATFTGGATAPSQDTVTFQGSTYTAKETSTGTNKATYTTSAIGISWDAAGPPPTGLQACSGILGACSAKFTADIGSHTVTITGSTGNPGTGGAGATSTKASPECDTSGDPLSWILCPVFNGVADLSDWLFGSIVTPFLITTPIDTSPGAGDPTYTVWSNFRLYGDIFLVIAMLVLVFGQAIGGGIVDAYTVKKALPRVLVAAILVNLSIYIVAFMIDLTNIIGKSIGNILIQPFKNAGSWSFKPNGVQGIGVFTIGIIGLILAGGTIAGILTGLFGKNGSSTSSEFAKVALEAIFFTLIPIFLAILAVFVTLIIRKGLILFLVLISPIAFALYCLPNTEQYFRKWWNLLLEALLVYPIIIVIFAVADILSITILNANNVSANNLAQSSAASIIAIIAALILQFLPLLLIPFAFRMAGGTLSKWHEVIAGAHAKAGEMTQARREHAKEQFSIQKALGQQSARDYLAGKENFANNKVLRKGFGFASRRAGGYNIDQVVAMHKAAEQKKIADQTGAGRDNLERASITNEHLYDVAKKYGKMDVDAQGNATGARYEQAKKDFASAGFSEFTDWKYDKNQGVMLANANGEFYSTATVGDGMRLHKGNQHRLQTNYAYLQRKAADDPQKQKRLYETFGEVAKSQGFGDQAILETTVAAGFENQGVMLDAKYRRYNKGSGKIELDGLGLARETAQVKDPFTVLRSNPSISAGLEDAYKAAREIENDPNRGLPGGTQQERDAAYAAAQETIKHVSGIVVSLKAGSYSLGGGEGDDEAARSAQAQAAAGSGGRSSGSRPIGSGASFGQLQAIQELVHTVDGGEGAVFTDVKTRKVGVKPNEKMTGGERLEYEQREENEHFTPVNIKRS
jgi:hypothetical protein